MALAFAVREEQCPTPAIHRRLFLGAGSWVWSFVRMPVVLELVWCTIHMSLDSLLWKKPAPWKTAVEVSSVYTVQPVPALYENNEHLLLFQHSVQLSSRQMRPYLLFITLGTLSGFERQKQLYFGEIKYFTHPELQHLNMLKNKILLEVLLKHIDLAVHRRNNLFHIKPCQLCHLHEWILMTLKF